MRDPDAAAQKVRALIDRAMHPSTPTEEARTSAFIALKLLTESGLTIATAGELKELTDLRAMARTNESSARAPFDPFGGFRRQRARREEPSTSYAVIVSTYKGRCKACRREYKEGAEIAWRRSAGATHYECRGYWDELDADAG